MSTCRAALREIARRAMIEHGFEPEYLPDAGAGPLSMREERGSDYGWERQRS